MLIDVHVPWLRIGRAMLPLILTCGLFLTSVPTVLAAPSRYSLALGDSLAAGFSSDGSTGGYNNIFFQYLKDGGVVTDNTNLGCIGETSYTYIAGDALKGIIPSSPCYTNSSQGSTALNYIYQHPGQVSPITLDIGANDLIDDFNINDCTVNSKFGTDWHTLDDNLGGILQGLHNTLVANEDSTADILVLNYYNPYKKVCPTIHRLDTGEDISSDQLIEEINAHLAQDVNGFGTLVDIFTPFSTHICKYTGMCKANLSPAVDIHPNAAGYRAMARAIEHMYPNH